MARQTYKQKPQTTSRERERYVREYEDDQHAARAYAARQAIKRARRAVREAEEFLREN